MLKQENLMFDRDEILYKTPMDLSDQEWKFLNNLDFDYLFKDDEFNKRNYRFSLWSILLHGLLVYDKDRCDFPCVSQLLNLVSNDKITIKGWLFIEWVISNKFNILINVIDLQFDHQFDLAFQAQQIFHLIPTDKYVILLSLSKNPSRMAQLISTFKSKC